MSSSQQWRVRGRDAVFGWIVQAIMAAVLSAGGTLAWAQNSASQASAASAPDKPSSASNAKPSQEATAGPRFSFADGTVRLPSGESKAYAILTATQLAKSEPSAKLSLSDVTPRGNDAVIVQFDVDKAIELQSGPASRSWLVPIAVSDLPVNSVSDRFAHVTLGETVATFGYQLSNRLPSTVEFGISARPQWVVTDDHLSTDVTIDSRDQPVAGLRLAQSTLSEQAMGYPIRLQSLELCANEKGECQAPPKMSPRSTKTFYLRLKQEDRRNGVFKGTVALSAEGRSEPKVFGIDALSSGACYQFLGALVIVLGVVWAWMVIVRGKLVVARLSALAAAATLREALQELVESVAAFESATGSALADLRATLERSCEALTEERLNAVLPRTWAFYDTYDNTKLKTALAEGESRLKVYGIVVHDGVEMVGRHWHAAASPADQASAVQILDNGTVADESAARTLATQAVAALKGAAGGGALASTATPTAATIIHRIEWTNFGAWVTYLVLVSISGISILILRAPGFGTWLDFVYCLFWGFGLPATLDKLQQMTPSSIATTIAVNMPK